MSPVTAAAAQAMDDTAAWAYDNVVRLSDAGSKVIDKAAAESAHRALLAAQAMHRAARTETDVGKFCEGLEYVSVYFAPIREFVTIGFEHTPEEPGDDEQPTIGETLEISEVWMRGVNIGILTLENTDALMASLEKAIKQGAEL